MPNLNSGARPTGWQRIYNALFRVFGPAQLGDPDEPPPPPLPPAADCPRCHRPMAAHLYVETPERKRLRCPDAESTGPAPAQP